jgi:hypothetical protein
MVTMVNQTQSWFLSTVWLVSCMIMFVTLSNLDLESIRSKKRLL